MSTEPIKFSITIGEDKKIDYTVVETNAPRDYDGFGTITLNEYGEDKDRVRWALVRDEHYQWQTGRYASGNNYAKTPDYCPEESIKQIIWERIASFNP